MSYEIPVILQQHLGLARSKWPNNPLFDFAQSWHPVCV
jgi:hypothetical protein